MEIMDPTLAKLSSNWLQIGGCDFSQAIQIQNADPDVFTKPTLDDLVGQEKALLLSKNTETDNCEVVIQLYPQYKIQAISLVCNANKIEIFQGHMKEYLETVYGTIADDGEEEDTFESYRYDVEVEKSGITELAIKFPSQSTEICLFGIMIQIAPNPNGITTLLPHAGGINIENVKSLLINSSISPASEKCKKLLELMEKSKPAASQISPTNANITALPDSAAAIHQLMLKQCNINQKQQNMEIDLQESQGGGGDSSSILKAYIDERLLQLEERLNNQLQQMEERQMEKLNRIFKVLEQIDNK